MSAIEGTAGAVIGESELRSRLQNQEIFATDTASESQVRGASYDLRIASDYLTIPDGRGGQRAYKRGEHRKSAVVLQPGEVAVVTSKEEFALPWDVAANIGVKFGFATRGLLVHTGLLIDPGYGNGENGKRLHFFIINIIDRPVAFEPGRDEIASIQFLNVSGLVRQATVEAVGASRVELEYLKSGDNDPTEVPKLLLLTNLRALEQKVARIESRAEDIILFGVYLLGAAYIGVILTQLLGLLGDHEQMSEIGAALDALNLTWPISLVLFGLFIALSLTLVGATRTIANFLLGFFKRLAEWVRRTRLDDQRR